MHLFKHVDGLQQFGETYEPLTFSELWNEYTTFMKKTYKRKLTPLKKGNKRSEIDRVVTKLNLDDIPEDFYTLYMLCNGNDDKEWLKKIERKGVAYAHVFGNPLMSLGDIEREIEFNTTFTQPDPQIQSIPGGMVKPNAMMYKKLPFQHDGGGNFFAIDLDPDTKGTYGQVVWVDHEFDERRVFAISLKQFIIIVYFFVKERGVIDNGEGYDQASYLDYIEDDH